MGLSVPNKSVTPGVSRILGNEGYLALFSVPIESRFCIKNVKFLSLLMSSRGWHDSFLMFVSPLNSHLHEGDSPFFYITAFRRHSKKNHYTNEWRRNSHQNFMCLRHTGWDKTTKEMTNNSVQRVITHSRQDCFPLKNSGGKVKYFCQNEHCCFEGILGGHLKGGML